MATLRDIKRRITSVKSTQQITRAMKMVSAAKLNRAQMAVKEAQPYAEIMRRIVMTVSENTAGNDHPFFAENTAEKNLVIVFSSDRGLCGTFNSGLNRFLTGKLRRKEIPHPELFLVGQKGYDWFKRMGYPIRDHILHKKPVDLPDAVKQAIHQATDDFLEKKYARVYMAYNTFYNPLRQEPTLIQLLPVVSDVQEAEKPNPAHGHTEEPAMTSSFLYEPSQEEILSHLLPQYLENQAFTALLNTFAGEHGSRMVAMEGATKNAGEMIHKLTLQYNRMRQAVITRELIEIINGAQSL